MKPYRCPVCDGKGTMPAGFYGRGGAWPADDECKACGGDGIVWGKESTPYIPTPFYPYRPYAVVSTSDYLKG